MSATRLLGHDSGLLRSMPDRLPGYQFWQQETAAGYQREAEVTLSVFEALNDTHREHPLSALLGTRVMGWLMVKL